MEKRLSSFDPAFLDILRGKAVALKTELEAASKVRTTPGKDIDSAQGPRSINGTLLFCTESRARPAHRSMDLFSALHSFVT